MKWGKFEVSAEALGMICYAICWVTLVGLLGTLVGVWMIWG